MALIEAGKKAPAFTLKDQDGNTHRLADYAGQHVVLYFYPKDDTPGCTQESCDFQANLATYKRRKAAVLGVSILDEKSKAKFATKHGLTFPLLADADHAVAEKYGATMLQLACLWNLSFPGVKSVIPTLIQEIDGNAQRDRVICSGRSGEPSMNRQKRLK